jgi:diaminohydroxyphosphoribosylaminopyrimidine deaminase/5-amino-6-(5-phosphoribosylamino)uracil reductase
MIEAFDREHLWNALQLAERGLYTTTPNPRVGCILVRNGEVVGEGWHERAGEAHAEVMALREAGDRARGATAYVTLEPCSHHGRTPPCADALIEAGVRRVVAAMQDPNPRVSGQGLERLRAAGIEVDCGALEGEARDLNIGFVRRMQFGSPWVRMKIAATLDGKTALENGVSQWITGPQARRDGHAWRARACALLTGIGTVKEDDPLLTVRDVPTSRQPPRIVVDSRMEIDLEAKILSQGKVLLFAARDDADKRRQLEDRGVEVLLLPDASGKVDLRQLIVECARREFNELHIEAGFKLNGSLMREGLIDELVLYLAPSIVGDRARGMFALPALDTLAGKTELALYDLCRVGDDVRIIARMSPSSGSGPASD